MRKYISSIFAFAAVMLLITGCGNEPAASSESSSTTESAETTAVATEETTVKETETKATKVTTVKTEPITTVTTEVTSENVEEITDFTGISGYWYIDGDPFAASVHITDEGKFEFYTATGSTENTGYIKAEKETVQGETKNQYTFCSDSGEVILKMTDNGSADDTELYSGSLRYVKLYGEGGLGDDGRGPDESFIGSWGCGRALLYINYDENGAYYAEISWADSAFANVEWYYPLVFENGKMICSGNGTKTYVVYNDENSDPVKNVLYTGGSAEFELTDAGIIWNDITENRGEDMVFVRY